MQQRRICFDEIRIKSWKIEIVIIKDGVECDIIEKITEDSWGLKS